jgi:DNA replication protein DnaC
VLESEVGVLEGRRYQARLKMAGLPHHKTLDEFDVAFQPDLDPKRLAELRSLRFVQRKVGCLILGPPGVGKSHISVGLAMEALARGYPVRYTTLDDLVRGLRQADALGKLNNKLAQLQRPHVLVIDEAGYLPLDHADANRIFGVVNRRYTRGSTIITSNKTVSEWSDTFGDETLAAAILDRLLHDAEGSRSTARATASRADSTRCDHSPSTTPTPPNQGRRSTTFDGDQPTFFDGA